MGCIVHVEHPLFMATGFNKPLKQPIDDRVEDIRCDASFCNNCVWMAMLWLQVMLRMKYVEAFHLCVCHLSFGGMATILFANGPVCFFNEYHHFVLNMNVLVHFCCYMNPVSLKISPVAFVWTACHNLECHCWESMLFDPAMEQVAADWRQWHIWLNSSVFLIYIPFTLTLFLFIFFHTIDKLDFFLFLHSMHQILGYHSCFLWTNLFCLMKRYWLTKLHFLKSGRKCENVTMNGICFAMEGYSWEGICTKDS